MENDDSDLFSIVRSCKATTFTTPAIISETPPQTLPITTTMTNNIISPQNTTPYCYGDFRFTQENSTIPIFPLKPNDFIELEKLIIRSNPTKIIPTPTTTNILTPSITTTIVQTPLITTPIVPTPSTITIPTHITNNTITNTSFHGSDQTSTFSYFPTHVEQENMQPSELTELENLILQFNTPTTIPISTIIIPDSTTPTTITPTTTTTTFSTPPTTINTVTTTTPIIPTSTTMINSSANGHNQYPSVSDFSIPVEQQQVQPNQNNQVSIFDSIFCIKTTIPKFHCEIDHQLVPQQPQRNHNQLPIQLPQTSFRALPNRKPKQQKFKSGKRKNDNQVSLVSYVGADKVSEDSWRWRKYGQKPIKGSSYPRSYYKCSSSSDCLARKKVEKIKDGDDTYEVTYLGEHNHNKPANNRNSAVGSSQYMSPKFGSAGEGRCFTNIINLGSSDAVMLQLDQPESSKARVLVGQSRIPDPKTELIESPLAALDEAKSPQNVEELDSPNIMMLQFDEQESGNSNVFACELEIPNTKAEFIDNSKEDDILIPNMTPMLEESFLGFNSVNSGALFH